MRSTSNLDIRQNMSQVEVSLSVYNPDWPIMFEREKKLLTAVAGEWLQGSVEHIGSTSVPGLIAKPVIDIMFGIETLDQARPAIGVLEKEGYHYYPYKQEIMHWFCKPSPEYRTHHVHLVPYQSELWNERIRFRELLRTNNQIAMEYADLKEKLSEKYPQDRESYTLEKWPFISRVLYHEKQK
ncbi:MAG: GrpB family protein [Pseudomonadota bacterium]